MKMEEDKKNKTNKQKENPDRGGRGVGSISLEKSKGRMNLKRNETEVRMKQNYFRLEALSLSQGSGLEQPKLRATNGRMRCSGRLENCSEVGVHRILFHSCLYEQMGIDIVDLTEANAIGCTQQSIACYIRCGAR
jgi:hypothetical protein